MDTFITICYAAIFTLMVLGLWCIIASASKCTYQRWRDNKRGYKPYCTLREKIHNHPSNKFGWTLLSWSIVGFLVVAVFNAFYRLFS